MGKQGQNRLLFPGGGFGGHDLRGCVSTAATKPLILARIAKERPFPGRGTFPFCGIHRRGFLVIISGKGPEIAGTRDSTMTEFC